MSRLVGPHGGQGLRPLLLEGEAAAAERRRAESLPKLRVSSREKGDLVMLELALVRFALDLVRGEGHEPVVPPVLVREEALVGTGFLPGDRDQIYEVPKDELFLVGTS